MAAVSAAGRETERMVRELDPRLESEGQHIDAVIARLADAQHGAVSLTQLARIGLRERAVQKRAENGRLHRVHRGVYAVGRRSLELRGRLMGAVLACGPGAVVSHRSAAHLLGL